MTGRFDLPFEEIPGAPMPGMNLHPLPACSITVAAAVVPDHPSPGHQHPALVFRFGMADGSMLPGLLLVLNDDEYDKAVTLLTAAIESARRAAGGA